MYTIALDGGGTKTEILLLDGLYKTVDSQWCGCVNHEQLHGKYNAAGTILQNALNELLGRNRLKAGLVHDLVAGIAGVDTLADEEEYRVQLERCGFSRLAVVNDGYLPIKANAPEGWGIAYNCGTGVCCNAIGIDGGMTKTGGLDEWAGDAGGGRWITQQVFRAVYDSYVLRLENTQLKERYFSAFGPYDEIELIESLMCLKREPERQKLVIRMLFDAAEDQDKTALHITEIMLDRAVAFIRAAIRRTEFGNEEIPVILTGSVLLKAASRSYLLRLEEYLYARIPHVHVKQAEHESVMGAVKWLQERNS